MNVYLKIKNSSKAFTRQNFSKKNLGGFTLVEVLVAMTLFVTTLVLLSQIYVSAMRSERVAYALLQNDESVRYALDYMSKTIRMGKDFHLSADRSNLFFNYYYVDPTGVQTDWHSISYSFQDNTIKKGFLGNYSSLIPPSVKISGGQWTLTPKTDSQQAKVTISFTVHPQQFSYSYKFQVRTAVTPRLLFNVGNPNP